MNRINGTETMYNRGYGYDRLDRLTSDGVGEDDPMTYGYALNDNRQTRKQGTGTDSIDELIDYMEGSNRIDQQSTLKRGTAQLPTIPDRNMVYSDTGRLYQLIETGTLKAEYIYNDNGQRTKKTLYQADGITVDTTTIYHYDSMGHLITETDLQGNLIKDYIWSNQMMPVAQIDNSGGTETITYLYTDHLMTNRLATSQSKTIIWRWEGEAFGNTPAQELSGVSVNLRFPGQYYDSETNLHYNWHRYYDPALGRYITSDPIGLQGGMNTYSYANQNPVIYSDPAGLLVCGGACLLSASFAIGAVVGVAQGISYRTIGSSFGKGFFPGFGYGFAATAIAIATGGTALGTGTGITIGFGIDWLFARATVADLVVPDADAASLTPPDMSSPDPVDDAINETFCQQNPNAPNCQPDNLCP